MKRWALDLYSEGVLSKGVCGECILELLALECKVSLQVPEVEQDDGTIELGGEQGFYLVIDHEVSDVLVHCLRMVTQVQGLFDIGDVCLEQLWRQGCLLTGWATLTCLGH